MKIVFAGSPAVAVPTLEALLTEGFQVVGVLTRPPARMGRGRNLHPTPVAEAARAAQIPVLETENPNDPTSLETLQQWDPELGVVVAYGAILRPEVLSIPDHGWINLHFSDLPRWRGAAPVQWTIRSGDDQAATCVFQLERGLDTGPVFARSLHALDGTETSGQLLEELAESGAVQVCQVARELAAGTALSKAQPETGVTIAPRLDKRDGFVDFSTSAREVDRIIRSVTPNPGAWTRLPGGAVLKLGPVTVLEGDDSLEPGELTWTKNTVTVACSRGAVRLGQVAPAGKKWMDAAAWVRGARLDRSARLGDSNG